MAASDAAKYISGFITSIDRGEVVVSQLPRRRVEGARVSRSSRRGDHGAGRAARVECRRAVAADSARHRGIDLVSHPQSAEATTFNTTASP
jgi:hypothetical protein